jgi:hypothetical protein
MSVLSDDFTTDTSANWAHSGGNAFFPNSDATWDLGAGELVMSWSASDALGVYASVPGSIDHEVQATLRMSATALEHCASAAPRMSGADAYWLALAADYRAALARYNAGAITALRYIDLSTGADFAAGAAAAEPNTSDWVTVRIAAQGAIGLNVTLSLWYVVHGASKPGADPGWIGTDASPRFVYVDTDAARLDDAGHVSVGIAGLQNAGGTRLDYWRARAITDRTVGVRVARPQIRPAAFSPGLQR